MTIQVELGARSYPIIIEPAAFQKLSQDSAVVSASSVSIVTNETIAKLTFGDALLLDIVVQGCEEAGKKVQRIIIPDGEEYKSLTYFEYIQRHLLEQGADRKSLLIALGGGVIGDITGFVAATYQRGIPFIQIPTTLLSQVDSSVGGKTAVNHALGKNMIGAFYQPKAVFIDPAVLVTLPPTEFSAGMAEVIKYALLWDNDFLTELEASKSALRQLDPNALSVVIRRCCQIKADIVSRDEQERGMRALLNLGHTFGHAIETEMGYGQWLHGEAVAAGMAIALRVSRSKGWVGENYYQRVINLLRFFNLPTSAPDDMTVDIFIQHMMRDKKTNAGVISFILPDAEGSCCISSDVSTEEIKQALRS